MLDFTTPYPSARLPVFARNLVATSHPLAAQAGLRMLAQGGNAVDAAIATAAAMTVCEPVSNGLGSDAFCILWDGQALHGLNASGRAPAAWTPDYFHRRYGTGARTPPKRGMDAVTVPGAVSAWVALSERFGRLPFADLMAPAAEIAERGYAVPVVVQRKWAAAVAELQGQPGFAGSFLPNGRAPQVGERFRFPAAARALRAIGDTRGAAFYQGEIAQAIARQNPQAACDAPRWRVNTGLDINVEAAMDPATVAGLRALGHHIGVIDDPYQDFGAGQFIWRLGDPGAEGYVAASDPRRDGQAVGF
jgi:gamma-glutamyltranspeptidase/glutathione hydrolase